MASGTDQALDEDLLGRAVLALELADELTNLCRLVVWWSERNQPPVPIRLAHARALIRIKQVDRAWHILRDLSGSHPENSEVRLLTAEMFIERGWGARASRILEDLSGVAGDESRVRLLRERMDGPSPEPPPHAKEISRTGTCAERLTLAEQYLLTGSQVRARTLLERLQREGHNPKRVARLLAGIRGEATVERNTQEEVLAELLGWLPVELEGQEVTDIDVNTDLGEYDPDTAEVQKTDLLDRVQDAPVFPALFRSMRKPVELDDQGDESTHASILADLDEFNDPPTEEASLGGPVDTQIMEVISSSEGLQVRPIEGDIHEAGGRRARNIKELVQHGAPGGSELDEEEEDDVVVMTERAEAGEDPTGPTARRSPIQVFEKYPAPPENLRAPSAIETIELPAVDGRLEEPTVELKSVEEDSADRFIRKRRGAKLIVFLVPVMLVAVGLGIWGYWMREKANADAELLRSARQAIVEGDSAEMGRLASQLLTEVESEKEPVGPRAATLALLESFLTADYTGDLDGASRAAGASSIAAEYGADQADLALIAAIKAWGEGDRTLALEHLGDAGEGALQEHVEARIELESQDLRSPEALDPSRVASPVWLASWVNHHPDLGQVEDLEERLGAATEAVQDPEFKRLKSNLLVAQTRLLVATGQSGALMANRAVEQDPRNPEALLMQGELAWAAQSYIHASKAFNSCLQLRPSDMDCLRGLVLSHVELDRVDSAVGALDDWAGSEAVSAEIVSWVAFAEGAGQGGSTIDPARETDRHRLSSELQRLQAADSPARGVDLDDAVQRLAGSSSPINHALMRRLEALDRIEKADSIDKIDAEDEASWAEWGDAWVLLALTRRCLAEGRRSQAQNYLDQLARTSSESVRVRYERGVLLQEVDRDRSNEVWRGYLDIGPTGPRADAIKAMGL